MSGSLPAGRTLTFAQETLRLLGGVLAVAVLAPLAGCASDGQSSPHPTETMFGLPVSDYQRDVLKDGRVTDAEFRAAWEDQRGCMTAEGFAPGPLERSVDGVHWEFAVSFDPSTGVSRDSVSKAYSACRQQFTDVLDVWKYNEAIPVGAERETALGELVTCLEATGVTGLTTRSSEADFEKRMAETFANDASSPAAEEAQACLAASFAFSRPAPVDFTPAG